MAWSVYRNTLLINDDEYIKKKPSPRESASRTSVFSMNVDKRYIADYFFLEIFTPTKCIGGPGPRDL